MEQFKVTGMSCAACSARVEKAVSSVDGVSDCSVNLLTESMTVEGTASADAIIKAVEMAGYGASIKGQEKVLEDKKSPKIKQRLIWSVILLLILMYFSMGHTMLGLPLPEFFSENYIAIALSQLLLSGIVMVINQKFFINGFKGLINKAPNMDTLVALGSGAAFVYSTYALFAMSGDLANAHKYAHELYFEASAMILTLITVGKLLEARAKGKTTDAIKSLMRLAPKTANVIVDGQEIQVPVEKVKKGDIFVVRAGDNIPVDGEVVSGSGAVNESALTGESIPVDKKEGDNLSCATVNLSGYMECRATRVGEDTTLSQIIKMVTDAAATKAPISKIADKVSGIFVPVVIAIATVTALVWLFAGESIGYALARGISVLVISCPCALGLATPVAVMVGSGVGAKNGILFKTATSLEITGKAKTVVLDKTGTITKGTPKVTDILPYGYTDEEKLIELAYSLEIKSEHPLAGAIIDEGKKRGAEAKTTEDFKVLAGNGLSAKLDGKILLGGKLDFIEEQINIPVEIKKIAHGLAQEGKTPLYFACGEEFLGIIAVADVIKEDSREAIAQLKEMGIISVMLTGDNKTTAEAIGKKAGVDEIIAGVLPEGKEQEIKRISENGITIMVGDGINDAPALTRADIGIAIGAGADVAVDAADVVLMSNSLKDVAAAIRLSRATLKDIKENLFWAFIYNVIGIPLAAGVYINWLGWELNPMFGAAAMSLSSVCVVANALRLNFVNIYKIKKEKKKMEKTLNVEGMMCSHCEARVKQALEGLPGVKEAIPSHEKGNVVIKMEQDITDDVLKATIEAQGYKVV